MSSFSRRVKNELARNAPEQPCCALAELRAFTRMCGKLVLNSKTTRIVLDTENASVARHLFSLFKVYFELTPEIATCKKKRFRRNSTFLLYINGRNESLAVLRRLGFIGSFEGNEEKAAPERIELVRLSEMEEHGSKCCRRAYLRGAFMSAGSLNNPETSYHMEIVAPCPEYAGLVEKILRSFGVEARTFSRKKSYVVYIKGAEEIGEFLRLLAAHNSVMEFENVRVVKGMRNRINRLVNCETANLTKTVVASQEQVDNIRLIERITGLEKLPPSLRQAARLRLRFPEATLKELGNIATPPLSKSSVNHRLRRINDLARDIKEGL